MARDHNLRSGKTMPFTSPDGAAHPNSFWCLDRIGVEIDDQAVRLRFVGYHDVAAYDAGKQPVAGAVKDYLISRNGFAQAVALPTVGANIPISNEILRLAWVSALGEHDLDDPTHAGAKISFFAGAADVG